MTMIQPAQPADSTTPIATSQVAPTRLPTTHPTAVADDLGVRVLREGRHARLDEALHAVAVKALGPDGRMAVASEEWARIEDVLRGPVAAAVDAALERLATDLQAALPPQMPGVVRRLGDHRLRVELGYD